MKNRKKFTKGCEKVHSPPSNPLRYSRFPGIYTHRAGHIYPPWWVYILTAMGIYIHRFGHISTAMTPQ